MSVVFALATPPAKSAICVFRVSGAGCFVGLSKLLKGSKYNIGEFHVRSFFDESGLIDRAGLVAFGSKSYTAMIVEVYAHGGLGVASSLSKLSWLVLEEALVVSLQKELNDKVSLSEAEAVVDLIDAAMKKRSALVHLCLVIF